MATYKKGYKKENPQLAILKTIVAILVAVGIFLLIAFIYDKSTDWKDYSSYEHIETYDKVLTNNDGNYVVYFYSETCSACSEIKDEVLGSINDINKDSDLFYFADTASIYAAEVGDGEEQFTKDDLAAVINIEEILTPMMVVVVDGQFEEVIQGRLNIRDFLDQVENDTYAPFNN
ncbi:MAG: hypothetical protein PF513_02475 [Tenericutes bacterium]|jgi:hypothetical protein|nr:hypothetical protein [Mycoplasmatota bacterium]